MIDQAQTDKFQEILDGSKQALVVFPSTKDQDLFLASYCLYSFLSKKLEVRLLSPKLFGRLPQVIQNLLDLSKIETELGKENLLISFPYKEDQVDKVSYFIGEQDQRFYLTIKPKQGIAPLDSKDVEFSYAGAATDLLFLCGVDNLEDLEQLYFAYEDLYKSTNTQLITLNNFIPNFGTLNLDMSQSSSYCEAMYFLLRNLSEEDVWLSEVLASLLLFGIESKSKALQSTEVGANTFLAVSELMKLGAKRLFKLEPAATKNQSVRIATSPTKAKNSPSASNQHHLLK